MDDETKKLLADTYALNKDNNDMLKKLISFQKWNQIYKIVYWSIIILSAVGAFYFIKPMLGDIFSVYTGGASVSSFSDVTKTLDNNKNNVQDLLKSLNQ
jgi:hypothetical protein